MLGAVRQHPPALRLPRRRSMSEGYGTYHPGVCEHPGCDKARAKHGFQNGRQRYKRYCSRHYRKLHDPRLHHGTHRLSYEERRKARLRKDACECCGWNEARCDLHRIIPGGPYIGENTITLCPNCHRVETESARLQDGFGGQGL